MDKVVNTDNTPINKIKQAEEKKSLWENIIDFFMPQDKEKNNKKETINPNIRGGYIKCNCPKNHNKYYCDNIYEILNYIKAYCVFAIEN